METRNESKVTNDSAGVTDTAALIGWVILTAGDVDVRAEEDTVEVYRLTERGLAALVAAGEASPGSLPASAPNVAPARFPLGQIVATPGALAALAACGQAAAAFLARHERGDWGELCAEDKHENELALRRGFRLLSSYRMADGGKLWVITDDNRGATTLLLPEEY